MHKALPIAFLLAGISLALAQTRPAATRPVAAATAPATAAASAPASAPALAGAAFIVTGDMPDALKKQISDSIALLDNKKYAELIEALLPPDMLVQMKASGQFDQTIAEVAKEADKFRALLVTIAAQNPTLGSDAEGRPSAKFPHQESDLFSDPEFILIDGKWRVD